MNGPSAHDDQQTTDGGAGPLEEAVAGAGQGNGPPDDAGTPTRDAGASSPSTGLDGPTSQPPSLGPARLAAIVVGVFVAALIVLFAFGRDTSDDAVTALLGARTPPVAGPLLDGTGDYDIDDHRGSWVLVNFFATWCGPCVAEHPDLVTLEQWGRQRGDVELVSVVFNDPPERVAEFFAERGGDWPVINNPAVPVDFKVTQVPESFLISPAGQVILHVQGQLTATEIQALIEERS